MLVEWADIPWGDLAFPSVKWALNHYREGWGKTDHPVQANPPGEWGNY